MSIPNHFNVPYRVLGLGSVPYEAVKFVPSEKNTPQDKFTLSKRYKTILPFIYRYYPEEKTIPTKDGGYMGAYDLHTMGLTPFHVRMKFYNDREKEKFRIIHKDGVLRNALTNKALSTLDNKETIFVRHQNNLYVLPTYSRLERFLGIKPWHQHSAIPRNQPVETAGSIEVNEKGKVIFICNSSGHYLPNAKEFISFIREIFDTLSEDCMVKIITDFENRKNITIYGKESLKKFLENPVVD